MATQTRQLVINITASATWTQLVEGNGGAAYAVPTGGRADTRLMEVLNLGANTATVLLAISTNNTIADTERIGPASLVLLTSEYASSSDVHVIQQGEGVWAKATGSSPNVTVRCSILEVT